MRFNTFFSAKHIHVALSIFAYKVVYATLQNDYNHCLLLFLLQIEKMPIG